MGFAKAPREPKRGSRTSDKVVDSCSTERPFHYDEPQQMREQAAGRKRGSPSVAGTMLDRGAPL
jgi:hypothetical protein